MNYVHVYAHVCACVCMCMYTCVRMFAYLSTGVHTSQHICMIRGNTKCPFSLSILVDTGTHPNPVMELNRELQKYTNMLAPRTCDLKFPDKKALKYSTRCLTEQNFVFVGSWNVTYPEPIILGYL